MLGTKIYDTFFFLGAKLGQSEFAGLMRFVASKKTSNHELWSKLEVQIYLFYPKSLDSPDQLDIKALSEARICSTDKIIYRVILDLAAIGRDKVIFVPTSMSPDSVCIWSDVNQFVFKISTKFSGVEGKNARCQFVLCSDGGCVPFAYHAAPRPIVPAITRSNPP